MFEFDEEPLFTPREYSAIMKAAKRLRQPGVVPSIVIASVARSHYMRPSHLARLLNMRKQQVKGRKANAGR